VEDIHLQKITKGKEDEVGVGVSLFYFWDWRTRTKLRVPEKIKEKCNYNPIKTKMEPSPVCIPNNFKSPTKHLALFNSWFSAFLN